MKTIELNKSYYPFPESWNELTAKQLLQVMGTLFLKNYKAEQMLLKLIQVLSGMSNYQFFRCRAEDLEEYFYLLEFLVKQEIDFTKNVLAYFEFSDGNGSKQTFYSPDEALSNLKMKEFVFTEDYFTKWCESERKDEAALNELVAVLYRPGKKKYDLIRDPEGDRRKPFVQNECSYNAREIIALWPPSVKLAIATWYGGCRTHIVRNNPDVFEGGSGEASRYGLVSVMLNIAEGGVFGDFNKVEEQYVHLVMMQLNELVDRNKQLQKQARA